MTNINPASESAREDARQGDGKFGAQQRAEAPADVIQPGTPDPAALSEQFLEHKRQAAELIRKGDRIGARSIAATIKRALPDAAYLRIEESDQSMTHGYWANKILDKDKQFLADIDDDTITTDEGEEFGYDGESVWEVLSDLPQQDNIPVVANADNPREARYAPEYAWLQHDAGEYALIDLNAALAED
jgi:hypothetical protein